MASPPDFKSLYPSVNSVSEMDMIRYAIDLNMASPPDFKSVYPSVNSVSEIDDMIGYAIDYQNMCDIRTTPIEQSMWDEQELEYFQIDVKRIDRLYYLNHLDHGILGQLFEMAARMLYKGEHVYIEFSAWCDYAGFENDELGVIFISKEANLFFRLILTQNHPKDLIYQSLAEDGIGIDEIDECSRNTNFMYNNAPMLKFLCHKAIHKNVKVLQHYSSTLPKILKESVDEFIIFNQARESYQSVSFSIKQIARTLKLKRK